jgi:hypothetical protein
MDTALEVATADELSAAAVQLRAWIEHAVALRPPPKYVTAVCLSVNTGFLSEDGPPVQWLRFQGYPDEDRGQGWDDMDLWSDAGTWSAPVFEAFARDFAQGEELAIVLTAALVRDAFTGGAPSAAGPVDVHVRPESVSESVQVGRLHPSGIQLESAGQNLWGPSGE